MLFFGPISSLFDFGTFAIMLWAFHAGPPLFRSGWFVESLATQTFVVLVIRTRRIPFWRSRPSRALLIAVVAVAAIGACLPYSPFSQALGFQPLPALFFAALAVMVVTYLALVEFAKRLFFERVPAPAHAPRTHQWRHRHMIRRRLAHWTHHARPQLWPRPIR